jgi:hypothetical protein
VDTYQVLSYGGGVQSSAMLVAACHGDLPDGIRPNVAIFADTQWEPASVIEYVARMTDYASQYGIEVCTLTKGSIRSNRGATVMPLYTKDSTGDIGITMRQCTSEFKILPIRREIRRRLGYKRHQHWKCQLETWLGITTDEAQRMKPSTEKFETVRWPLIEMNWNREDCKRYLEKHGLDVPMKSSCIGCPYHSNKYFLDMKKQRPDEWQDVVAFDQTLRSTYRFRKLKGRPYIHRNAEPLDEVYLQEDQIELFAEECSGYCEA